MNILQQYKNEIQAACKQYHVANLFVFGSAARNEMNTNSDVDFLVSFKNDLETNYFDNYFDFQYKLEEILRRNIDLISENTLKNPYLINSINADKIMIYAA